MQATTYSLLAPRRQAASPEPIPERQRRELVAQARSGDRGAFARLCDFYAERVYGYVFFNVGDEQTAEELTARVFLEAWRTIPCYEPEKSPLSVWLYLIARSTVIEHGRGQDGAESVKDIVAPADEGWDRYEATEPCTAES